ncbi:MAG: ABC transporter ATP-binding protein [Candidatus Sericytochromatia bacterium]|nr:ABC transporter ATP-binding protein [Candidatus Tanganyikabacteria bacterium]
MTDAAHTRNVIEIRNLRIDYEEVCAVRDLTLDIGRGEIFGLIGANGAGKTSTLKALVGLLEPTWGEVRICGFDFDRQLTELRRSVGYMADFAPVFEDLTVWEYMAFFAAAHQIPRQRRDAAIRDCLELVELSAKADARTASLSRGMRQRLVLGKTLVHQPQVFLLDEPASGMDPAARAMLKRLLVDLARQGRTILISSHVLPDLSEICTSTGIMEMGRLVEQGAVGEVTARAIPRSRLRVAVAGPTDGAGAILAADPHVAELSQGAAGFECAFSGTDEDAAALLATLVGQGVAVSAFARDAGDLDSVFLAVGATEVT